MENFTLAMQLVFQHEGEEFVDNPNDSGGPTKWGITLEDLKEVGIPATVDEIKSLTQVIVLPIYKQLYWDKLFLDQVKDQKLSAIIMDQAVLHGVPHMAYLLQKISKVKQDGIVGAITMGAINTLNPKNVCLDILSSELISYCQIAINNPKDVVFLMGWINRIISLYNYVFYSH